LSFNSSSTPQSILCVLQRPCFTVLSGQIRFVLVCLGQEALLHLCEPNIELFLVKLSTNLEKDSFSK